MPWQQPQLRQSDPPSSTSPSSPASPSPSSPPPAISAVRHHISLLERGRYYLALAARLPASTTLSALATALYDKPAARRLLLPYVNGGGLALLYEMLLESAQPELCATMEVVLAAAEAGHGVLFFCRAGKDRTGLVAALVLSTAGASDQQIVEDYARWVRVAAGVGLAGMGKQGGCLGRQSVRTVLGPCKEVVNPGDRQVQCACSPVILPAHNPLPFPSLPLLLVPSAAPTRTTRWRWRAWSRVRSWRGWTGRPSRRRRRR